MCMSYRFSCRMVVSIRVVVTVWLWFRTLISNNHSREMLYDFSG